MPSTLSTQIEKLRMSGYKMKLCDSGPEIHEEVIKLEVSCIDYENGQWFISAPCALHEIIIEHGPKSDIHANINEYGLPLISVAHTGKPYINVDVPLYEDSDYKPRRIAQPDASYKVPRQRYPRIIIENAMFNESTKKLLSKLVDYLVGSDGAIKYAIGIKTYPSTTREGTKLRITMYKMCKVSDAISVDIYYLGNDLKSLSSYQSAEPEYMDLDVKVIFPERAEEFENRTIRINLSRIRSDLVPLMVDEYDLMRRYPGTIVNTHRE